MVAVKLISTTFFAVLLAGLVSSAYYDFNEFIFRLKKYLNREPTALSFTMCINVLRDLAETTDEFQNICLRYETQSESPAKALKDTILYLFFHYKQTGNAEILSEIEIGDPVGFNAYLRKKRVDKKDSVFKNHTNIFVSTMRSRIHLQAQKYALTNIPQHVRYPIGREYAAVEDKAINYFIKLAEEISNKKMYAIDLLEIDKFNTYKNKKVDDVQVFGGSQYDYQNHSTLWHALCINYKASTRMVHIYDSANSGNLDDRQKAIINKLYPNRDIQIESPTGQIGDTTCGIFAITYATMLILGRDPAKYSIKLNEVYGDETLYMRLNILDMLNKKKLILPELV